MKTRISLNVNGSIHDLEIDPKTPLLYVLRNQLQLNGPKYGCGEELCGACMVLVDDLALTSCKLSVGAVEGKSITTIEGLMGKNGELHPVQKAIIDEQAAQCGYCLNGMIIATVSMLRQDLIQDEEMVSALLHKNLCRCGSHTRILRAITSVAETVASN